MSTRFLFTLAILAISANGGARSRPSAPPPGAAPPAGSVPAGSINVAPVAMMIAAFDADGDGLVSRAEYDAGAMRAFDSIAEGRDSLSLIDLSHWAERWLGNAGAVPGQFDFDRDGDDRISRAEYRERFAALFDGYDADKDGRLSRKELVTVGQTCGRPGFGGGRRGGEGGSPPGGGRRGGRPGGWSGGGMGGGMAGDMDGGDR